MNLEHFKQQLAVHGADLSRWPVEEVKPALSLMLQSAEAKLMFDEMEKLDQMLRQYEFAALNTGKLATRIMKKTQGMPQAKEILRRLILRPRELYVSGTGLAFAAILGFMIGIHPGDTSAEAAFYTQEDHIINNINLEF